MIDCDRNKPFAIDNSSEWQRIPMKPVSDTSSVPPTLAVIGLGYVGLPLAAEFGKQYKTYGFDINRRRLDELRAGQDRTRELDQDQIEAAIHLTFTDQVDDLQETDYFIVTVPTPIDEHKRPDLSPLYKASEIVGRAIRPGAIVVYESTVYPGCTEEYCVPVIERVSGLKYNRDFFCGYSPERINPGDKQHRLTHIRKVTSGSTPEAADKIDALYRSIIKAGTYKAPGIKVAEAAKVIENCQRDLNIAFVNELACLFERMEIDTRDVLEAAGTKWNFLPFRPGLVGGHCIGVDPYYLTYKAEELGHHPQIILAGRRLNDSMGAYIANRVVKLMIRKGHRVRNSRVLVLGITFKENCPDIRNSRVIDVVRELQEFGCTVSVHDPWADPDEVRREYGLTLAAVPDGETKAVIDAVILAVAHDRFRDIDFDAFNKKNVVIFDVRGQISRQRVDDRL